MNLRLLPGHTVITKLVMNLPLDSLLQKRIYQSHPAANLAILAQALPYTKIHSASR